MCIYKKSAVDDDDAAVVRECRLIVDQKVKVRLV